MLGGIIPGAASSFAGIAQFDGFAARRELAAIIPLDEASLAAPGAGGAGPEGGGVLHHVEPSLVIRSGAPVARGNHGASLKEVVDGAAQRPARDINAVGTETL